jgi:hypothetical protein
MGFFVGAPTQRLQRDTAQNRHSDADSPESSGFSFWRADCIRSDGAETVLDLARLNWFDMAAPEILNVTDQSQAVVYLPGVRRRMDRLRSHGST